MTEPRLVELQKRIDHLRELINRENLTDQPQSVERLAKFVMLNSHSLDYPRQLYMLLEQTQENDPLRDNILLAQARLIKEEEKQAVILTELHKQYKDTDGGIQALYELGLLKSPFGAGRMKKNRK